MPFPHRYARGMGDVFNIEGNVRDVGGIIMEVQILENKENRVPKVFGLTYARNTYQLGEEFYTRNTYS